MADNGSEFNPDTDSTSSSSPQRLHTPDPSPIRCRRNLQEHQPSLAQPETPIRQSQRLQLQTPNTQPEKKKKKKGPIPSFFPGQKFGPKEAPKMPLAQKAPRKAPANTTAKRPLKPKRRSKSGGKLITIMITIDLPTNL